MMMDKLLAQTAKATDSFRVALITMSDAQICSEGKGND